MSKRYAFRHASLTKLGRSAALLVGTQSNGTDDLTLTITASTIISASVSLTLSPALAALLLKPYGEEDRRGIWRTLAVPLNRFFAAFNRQFERLSLGYGAPMAAADAIAALVTVQLSWS